jgi:AmmeMemoRadiSam system protein A
MSQAVSIVPTENEAEFLFDIVRRVIERGLSGLPLPSEKDVPEPPEGVLRQPMGAFVTLHRNGRLRGCIGTMQPSAPLYLTVALMAWNAAFRDHRFHPLTREEMPGLTFDISLLGPMAPCPDREKIELGRHGIMLQARGRGAVFLPQVPVEQGWTLTETLEQLCRKAALPPGAWREKNAVILWYESVLIKPRESFPC